MEQIKISVFEPNESQRYRLTLIELAEYGAPNFPEILEQAFSQLKGPPTILLDSLVTQEAQYAIQRANQFGLVVADFTIPPLSLLLANKLGMIPYDLLRLLLSPLLLRQESNLLSFMREQSQILGIHPSVIHGAVAEFNLEISTQRPVFESRCHEAAERLITGGVIVNWYRYQRLALEGEVVAIFGAPGSSIFYTDYSESASISPLELQVIEQELSEHRRMSIGQQPVRSKIDSLLLLYGIDDLFSPDRVSAAIQSGMYSHRSIERLKQELDEFIKTSSFLQAAKRAQALIHAGHTEFTASLTQNLNSEYDRLRDAGHSSLASVIAEILAEYDREAADKISSNSTRDYWQMLANTK